MDSNLSSARTSLISSVDSCYTNDSANFAHLLAMAAESMSGASLSGKQEKCHFWNKKISCGKKMYKNIRFHEMMVEMNEI